MSIFFASVSPLISMVLARIILGERLTWPSVIAIALGLAGLAVMVSGVGGDGRQAPDLNGQCRRPARRIVFALYSICVRMAPGKDFSPRFPGSPWSPSWPACGDAGAGQDACPAEAGHPDGDAARRRLHRHRVACFNAAASQIPAVGLTVLAQTETILSPVWAFLILGRFLSYTLAGGLLILTGVLVSAMAGPRTAPRRDRPPLSELPGGRSPASDRPPRSQALRSAVSMVIEPPATRETQVQSLAVCRLFLIAEEHVAMVHDAVESRVSIARTGRTRLFGNRRSFRCPPLQGLRALSGLGNVDLRPKPRDLYLEGRCREAAAIAEGFEAELFHGTSRLPATCASRPPACRSGRRHRLRRSGARAANSAEDRCGPSLVITKTCNRRRSLPQVVRQRQILRLRQARAPGNPRPIWPARAPS